MQISIDVANVKWDSLWISDELRQEKENLFIIEAKSCSLSAIHGDYKGGIKAVERLTNSLWRQFNFKVGKFETCIVLCSRFVLDCKFQ